MTKPYTCIPGHSVLAPFLIVRATDEGVTLLSFSVRIYNVLFFSLNFLTYLNQLLSSGQMQLCLVTMWQGGE